MSKRKRERHANLINKHHILGKSGGSNVKKLLIITIPKEDRDLGLPPNNLTSNTRGIM